ncbi:hypothetical protein [Rhizobium sp. BK176]|uniref:hypothetical protein n=1 Tax=Rhizobium sp. BK176 TaxID=2587071 RepID=UPI00216AA9CF|nr:hypothetical protein [Rhizobium sp. BK176]MCS4089027.1 hypothetical protein [Rhizobium sp. BK176]
MFPKEPQGEKYPDLYEEVASKNYDIASVFGTPPPKQSFNPTKTRRPAHKPTFVTEVKKKRHFTRPGEEPRVRAEGEAITKDNLFKPRF